MVRLGEVLLHRKEFIQIDDFQSYRRCRVQLHTRGIVLRDTVPGAEIKTKKQQVCKAGEFLVAEIDAKHGGYGIVPDSLDQSIVSSHYFLFDIDEVKLSQRFLSYYIQTPTFFSQISAQGSTNYAAIRPGHVLEFEIPLPSLPEQQRTVEWLDSVATRIEEAKHLRGEASSYLEALMSSERDCVFTGLSTSVAPRPLGQVAQCRLGKMVSGNRGDEGQGVPYLRNANIRWDRLDLSSVHRIMVSQKEKDELSLKPGDILTCEGRHLGKSAIWNGEIPGCIFQKALHRIRLDQEQILPRFMLHHMFWSAMRGDFNIHSESTIPHLTGVMLKRHPVYIPPIAEQQKVVSHLDAFQSKVAHQSSIQSDTRESLEALFPAILNQAFNGQSQGNDA